MSSSIPLLAFFTDPRSGPARRMDSLLAHLARRERGRLRLRRVDVEEHPELAQRLQVEVVPTLLLIKGRRVVGRLEGRASAPRIEQMLEPHLADVADAA
jgi:thioredoxin-like negative regulator of GroEL